MPPALWRSVPHLPAASGAQPVDSLTAGLLAAGRGDASAFAAVYDGIAPRVYGLVLRIVGDAGRAAEVTHQALVEIWQTASRFDPRRESAQSWLMTTAHRRAVRAVRDPSAGANGTTARRGAATSGSLTGATPSIPAAPDAAPDARCIEPALGTLTASQRQALELSYFAGCTTRQVAGVSEESVEAATAGIRDGLIRLRDTLAPVPGHRAHSAG